MDFEEFVSIFANGRGIAAQSPIPPGIFGYRDGEAGINHYVYDWVDGAPKRKSIEAAKNACSPKQATRTAWMRKLASRW